MGKLIEQAVLKLRRELGATGGFLYLRPAKHILAGFVCERGSGGFYVWRYALPLYDVFEVLTLTFGERLPLPDGFIEQRDSSSQEIADDFLRRIARYEKETMSWQEPQNFVDYFGSGDSMRNIWVRRGVALTQIISGDVRAAAMQLTFLATSKDGAKYPGFREEIDTVLAHLSQGLDPARRYLLSAEERTKLRFGIE